MDNRPLTKGNFEDAWHLTAVRAARLLQHMVTNYDFPPDLISAGGFGSKRTLVASLFEIE